MKQSTKDNLIYLAVGFLFISLIAFAWVFKSKSEMETFNKFTSGEKATLKDAMFSELRIFAERD